MEQCTLFSRGDSYLYIPSFGSLYYWFFIVFPFLLFFVFFIFFSLSFLCSTFCCVFFSLFCFAVLFLLCVFPFLA